MATLADIDNAEQQALMGNTVLTKPTLAINAGTALTFKSAATTYACQGIIPAAKTISANAFTAGHKTQLLGGYTCFYVVGVNLAGTVSTYQSTFAFLPEVQSDGTTWFRGFAMGVDSAGSPTVTHKAILEQFNSSFLPNVPLDVTAFGAIKLVATSANFVPNTSALDLAGTTATYIDFKLIPTNVTL